MCILCKTNNILINLTQLTCFPNIKEIRSILTNLKILYCGYYQKYLVSLNKNNRK